MVAVTGIERGFLRPGGGRLVALSLASLRIPRGALWTLTGPNGSGKTTLLHLLAGLLRPDRGAIAIGGVRTDGLPEATLDLFRARNVGYVLQGGQLMECLTAEENVLAAMVFAGHPARERRLRAAVLLDRFGVAHRARHRPCALSGGERQRVALARALANRPPLLLADEPLASLDDAGALDLAAELRRLASEEGVTVLVATHQAERWGADGAVALPCPGGVA